MEREVFLDRIASRLGRPRRHRAPKGVPGRSSSPILATHAPEGLLTRFTKELERVGGLVMRAKGVTNLKGVVESAVAELGAQRIVSWGRSEFDGFSAEWLWNELGARAFGDPGFDDGPSLLRASLSADLGVTSVEAAIADTGSLVVSAGAARPRGVSLIPRVHLALVHAHQIVPSLCDALAAHSAPNERPIPSAIHVITGPSRTSDIENDLTIGVHGPAAVIAVVLESAS